MTGAAIVYAITHDKDTDEDNNPKEPHTHIVIIYKTPRKLSTIANLLQVPANFIEVVKNKQGILRYLTHQDDKEKYQYDASAVITNAKMSYLETLHSVTITDKEIAEYIASGRGMDLIGIVEPNKLGAIQRFMHYDLNSQTLSEIRALRRDFNKFVIDLSSIVEPIMNASVKTFDMLHTGMVEIARSIDQVGNH